MNKTLDYYNTNAEQFVQGTVCVDFHETQNKFLGKLKEGANILDFGCGSGRDTKYFLDKGYRVVAIDGSEELCKMASDYTGIEVRHMYFEDLDERQKYDGIWACSSILHLPKDKLTDVFHKMIEALTENGVIYTSFKYGDFEGERSGRYFTDFTSISESRVNVIAPVFTDPTKTSAESNANSVDNNNSGDYKSGKKPFWKRIFGKR